MRKNTREAFLLATACTAIALVVLSPDRSPVRASGGVDGGSSSSTPIGKVDQGTGGSSAWKVDGSSSNQPVSPVTGQSGVDGGAGASSAKTQRMTLASDDAEVTDIHTLAGAVSSSRVATNLITGQSGVDGGAGASSAKTMRSVLSSDSTVTANNNPDATASGSLVLINDAVTITLAGQQGLGVELSGTWSGVVSFEAQIATSWVSVRAVPLGGGANVTTATANGSWEVIGGGIKAFRARFSTATSGTATCNLLATTRSRLIRILSTDASNVQVAPISGQSGIDGGSGASSAATTRTILSTDTQIQGRAANGAAASGNPVLVAYVDSTSITRTSRSDASGRARAAWGDQPTYWVNVTSAITAATAPTDIFCITGSDTATVRVFIFQILCGKTAAQTQPQLGTPSITFVKRSTRDSNDTKVTQTPIAADSSRPAATASVFHYTTNPGTLGTLVGTLGISYSLIPALSSAPLSITFGANSPIAPGQTQSSVTECSGTLKGSGECLCCNLAGQTLTGFQFSYAVGWTETSD